MNQWPTSIKLLFGRAAQQQHHEKHQSAKLASQETAAAKKAAATDTSAIAAAAEAAYNSSGRDCSDAPTLENPGASVLLWLLPVAGLTLLAI